MQSIPPQQIAPQIVGQVSSHVMAHPAGMVIIQNQSNGAATTGMVLGIISMVISVLSPLTWFVCCVVSIHLAFIGVIFSHVGYSTSKTTGFGGGQALTGLILNWMQLLMVFIPIMVFMGVGFMGASGF